MIVKEDYSKALPTYTSIFFKLPYFSRELFKTFIEIRGAHYDSDNQEFELPTNKLPFVVNELSKIEDIEFIPLLQNDFTDKEFSLPEKFSYLYQHQKDGVKYGALRDNGWLLLDDCGLGKTVQIICLAEYLQDTIGLEHCFIICGINDLKYTWENEINKFSDLSCRILGRTFTKNGKSKFSTVDERCEELGKKMDEFFIITNIQTLHGSKFLKSFNKGKNKFGMCVLDEAHKCKNPSSQSAKRLLKMKCDRCIALTGTIIMNAPEDAYVPLKWTGNTDADYTDFKHMYNIYGGYGGKQVLGTINMELLKELVEECSLRRTKGEVLDLPSRIFKTEYVEMLPEQDRFYNEVSIGIMEEMNKLDHKPSIIEEITINMRLRQITASPSILSTDISESCKLNRLEDIVDEAVSQGDKVVVFTTFKETSNEAYRRLSRYNPVLVTGDTPNGDVPKFVDKFQNDNSCKVFVGTWQKCGTGLTLTAASYLIFVDTPWTDADFKQASDRIYRIGQTKPVEIITLVAKDTYDERVLEIIGRKEKISKKVIKPQ